MNVSPSQQFSQFEFLCPQCKWPHWMTKNQLKHGLPFPCDCGAVFTPLIKGVKQQTHIHATNYSSRDERFNAFVETLENWGYSKQEATERIKVVIDTSKSVETILKEAIYVKRAKT